MKYTFTIKSKQIEVDFSKEFLIELKHFKGKCNFINCYDCPFRINFESRTICVALEKEIDQKEREKFRLQIAESLLKQSIYKQIDLEV